jgi:Holliday junction resolvasome RuvABC endonuclease subunit
LLPGCIPDSSDSADALAIAICHIHHRKFKALKSRIEAMT